MILNLVASPKVAALVAAAEGGDTGLRLTAEVLNAESEENQELSSAPRELGTSSCGKVAT